jgi:hypothetical protein
MTDTSLPIIMYKYVKRGLIFRSNHTFVIQRNNRNVRLLDSEARL